MADSEIITETSESTSILDNFFEFDDLPSDNLQETTNKIELECINYLHDPSTEISSLESYPTVKKLFVKYNTSLASSAPVERAFSYGGMIFLPKRSNLTDEMFNMLVVLKVKY